MPGSARQPRPLALLGSGAPFDGAVAAEESSAAMGARENRVWARRVPREPRALGARARSRAFASPLRATRCEAGAGGRPSAPPRCPPRASSPTTAHLRERAHASQRCEDVAQNCVPSAGSLRCTSIGARAPPRSAAVGKRPRERMASTSVRAGRANARVSRRLTRRSAPVWGPFAAVRTPRKARKSPPRPCPVFTTKGTIILVAREARSKWSAPKKERVAARGESQQRGYGRFKLAGCLGPACALPRRGTGA